jgi:hypothetical protein
MEHHPRDKPWAEPIPQPQQMAGVARIGRRRGLDLEGDYVTAAQLSNKIDLAASVLFPQVVQARAQPTELGFGPDLRNDEGVDQPAEQIAITLGRRSDSDILAV